MRKRKASSIRAVAFCTFCNKEVEPGAQHVTVCAICGGSLHNNGKDFACASCGRRFPLNLVEVSSDTGTEGQDCESYTVDPELD